MFILRILLFLFLACGARFLTNGWVLDSFSFASPFPEVSWWGVGIGAFICWSFFFGALNCIANSGDHHQKVASVVLLAVVSIIFLFSLIGFTDVTMNYGLVYAGSTILLMMAAFTFFLLLGYLSASKKKPTQ